MKKQLNEEQAGWLAQAADELEHMRNPDQYDQDRGHFNGKQDCIGCLGCQMIRWRIDGLRRDQFGSADFTQAASLFKNALLVSEYNLLFGGAWAVRLAAARLKANCSIENSAEGAVSRIDWVLDRHGWTRTA